MYPYVRFAKEVLRARRMAPLGLFDTHISHHICWPWDTDPWGELNNGRTLTLFDLGRVPLMMRTGLAAVLSKGGYGMTVAGSTMRYRMRVRPLTRLEMASRLIGWDARFVYMDHSFWQDGACTSHLMVRQAIVRRGARGMVPPSDVLDHLAPGIASPELPNWLKAWIAAEGERTWPPEKHAVSLA